VRPIFLLIGHVICEGAAANRSPGLFNFDAVSNDGRRIFVIQYVTNTEYFVRRYGRRGWPALRERHLRQSRRQHRDGRLAVGWEAVTRRSVAVQRVRPPGQESFIHALALDDSGSRTASTFPGMAIRPTSTSSMVPGLELRGFPACYAANEPPNHCRHQPETASRGVRRSYRTYHHAFASSGFFAQDVQAKEFGASGAVLSPDGKTLVVAGQTGLVWSIPPRSRRTTAGSQPGPCGALRHRAQTANVYAVSDAGMIAELR